MKTKEELNALKEEVEKVSNKLAELTDEELKIVTGGVKFNFSIKSDFVVPKYNPNYAPEIYFNTDTDFSDALEKFKKGSHES